MCDFKSVDNYLKANKSNAFSKAETILGGTMTDSRFSGLIGGKNATYSVDVCSYSTAQDYVDAWIDNHNKIYEQEKNASSEKSSMRIHKLLQDELLKDYICNYLKRTYYRKSK